jgi:hypothetical protein
MFDSKGRVGPRGMWGIVGLAKKYAARIVAQACKRRQPRALVAEDALAGSGACDSPVHRIS